MAREHGEQQREAVAVEAAREPPRHRELAGRDERLHVDRQRARALHGDERARAGPVEIGAVVQPARVRDRHQAAIAHLEQPDLVGRAEAVLLRAQYPQRAQRIALEHQHDVHEVLEHARARRRRLPSSRARSARCRCSWPWPGAAGARPTPAPARPSPAPQRAARPTASGSSRRRTTVGRVASIVAQTVSSSVSASTPTPAVAPIRSARSRTCSGDSSPATQQHRPLGADRAEHGRRQARLADARARRRAARASRARGRRRARDRARRSRCRCAPRRSSRPRRAARRRLARRPCGARRCARPRTPAPARRASRTRRNRGSGRTSGPARRRIRRTRRWTGDVPWDQPP